MSIPTLTDASRWVLIVVFGLAAMEKLNWLLARSAARHPLLTSSTPLRRFGTRLLALSLVADAITLGLLARAPSAGGAAAFVLIVGYTAFALRTRAFEASGGCRCFAGALETSSSLSLLMRNTPLAAMAVLTAAAHQSPVGGSMPWAVLLFGALLTATSVLEETVGRGANMRWPDAERASGALARTREEAS